MNQTPLYNNLHVTNEQLKGMENALRDRLKYEPLGTLETMELRIQLLELRVEWLERQ